MCSISLENSDSDKLIKFYWVIVSWILVNSVFSVLQFTSGESFYLIAVEEGTEIGGIQRGYGLIGMATMIGAVFCLGIPLICSFLLQKFSWKILLAFILSYIGLFLTFSRGAIMGTSLSIIILLFIYKRWKLLRLVIIIILLAFICHASLMAFLPEKI